ncbi:hypothetical protein FCZ54_15920 [Escherichia coli]|nr:hypothetical protein [Escherichia coli]
MPKSVIIPAGSSAPLAPFVPGTLADGVVYVSGTLAFDQHNNVLFADDPKVWGSDQFWAEFVQPGRTCKPCVARGVVI